jgi:hypothetical protein
MKTILIILAIAAVAAGAIYIATKYFKAFKDVDNDGIPDEVEDKVAEGKAAVTKTVKQVKTRAKRVKEELGDVVDAAKDVVEQSKDVVKAAKGGARKGRKPAANKAPVKKAPAKKAPAKTTKPKGDQKDVAIAKYKSSKQK